MQQRSLWVEQVRELLVSAEQYRTVGFRHARPIKAGIDNAWRCAEPGAEELAEIDTLRRRQLLALIGLKRKRFELSDEIRLFVLYTGHEVLQALDNEQLQALNCWIDQWLQGDECFLELIADLPEPN